MRTSRRRLRLHRLSLLVLLLGLASTVGATLLTSHLVEQHEEDLLLQEADEISFLFSQLGASYQSGVVGAAAIAEATDGDPRRFAEQVARAEPGGAWVLFAVDGAALTELTATGDPFVDLATAVPSDWQATLEAIEPGEFAVLGIVGEGTGRYVGLAARSGEYLVYDELPLFAAAATEAEVQSDGDPAEEAYADFDFGIYVGREPSPEGLIFESAPMGDDAVTEVVSVGGTDLSLLISSKEPLGGSLVSRWPIMAAALGLVVSVGLTTAIELVQRRRDDALRQVDDLAAKNAALDLALADRQRAEEATLAVEAELRQLQRLESIGQLAGGVAHDFNNLLAVILSYTDLLARQLPEDLVGAREDLDEIREAARRGADLTRRLLLFSRQQETQGGRVDVDATVQDLARLLERALGEDLELHLDLGAGGHSVPLDAGSLEQAVLNLVVNARDALAPGGAVTITTAALDVHPLEAAAVPGLEPGPYVRLEVVDDGHGMAPDVARRAFDPFFTTKERGQGTGLGLATVYGMVQSVGGHVSIASRPGSGTTITLLLPVADEAADPPVPPAPARAGAGGRARVLVVEDEPAVRSAVSRMLTGAGYAVTEAADGAGAIGAAARGPIDLLLTDVVMPGGRTGADVAEALRADRPDLPALFVTGYGEDLLAQRGSEPSDGGADRFADHDVGHGSLLRDGGVASPAGTAVSLRASHCRR